MNPLSTPPPDLLYLLRKLRAVHAVGVLGHTVGAAQALHLSQSAVARAVLEVEQRLGTPLFERVARGMRPTEAGEVLVRRSARALEALLPMDRQPRTHAESPLAWKGGRVAGAANGRHLQAFLAVCRSGQEKRAAQALGVSPAAVHEAVTELEHLCATPLFERHRQGVRPTAHGERAWEAAQRAVAELTQAGHELAALHGQVLGHVVVGTLPFSTGLFVPTAVEAVLGQHPDLRISVIDGTYDQLTRQLRFAEIDLVVGALRDPALAPDLQQDTLFEDPLAVVARADHPLGRRRRLKLADLQQAAWIMPMPNTPAQMAFDQAFAAEGLRAPDDSLRVNSPVLMLATLMAGQRLALMSPRHVQAEVAAGLLCVLPVVVRHTPRRIGVLSRRDYLPAPGARLLLQAMRTAVAQAIPSIKPNA